MNTSDYVVGWMVVGYAIGIAIILRAENNKKK
jgi:hypothetical protein